jgi:hypothetical protein
MYRDGNAIAPMAEFAFRMRYDADFASIANLPLPTYTDMYSNNPYGINNNSKWPPNSIASTYSYAIYSDYANWLGNEVVQTLQYYITNNYWDNLLGFKQKPTNTVPIQINQQAGFATAMFYLGAYYVGTSSTISTSYLQKSAFIAMKYKGTVEVKIKETNFWGNEVCNDDVQDIFKVYDATTNAYTWHTNGWEKHRDPMESATGCLQNETTGYFEDISHATVTISFPLACYEYQQQFWGQTFFTSTDMQRFANTLTHLLYFVEGNGDTNFYFSVNTGDNACYICTFGGNAAVNYSNRHAALAFAPFENYDTYSSLYSLLMDYYSNTLDADNTNLSEGNHYLGLAELCQLQWQKECVNLTLHNRDLTYNQDFNAKNKLIISPSVSNANSFADPITTDNKFIIRNGVTANFTAGETIELLPGFETELGSNVSFSITPNQCTDGNRYATHTTTNTDTTVTPTQPVATNIVNGRGIKNTTTQTTPTKEETHIPNQNQFLLYPNPVKTNITAILPSNKNAIVSITDVLGNIVQEKTYFNEINTINLADLTNGLYSIKIKTENKLYVRMFVKE